MVKIAPKSGYRALTYSAAKLYNSLAILLLINAPHQLDLFIPTIRLEFSDNSLSIIITRVFKR